MKAPRRILDQDGDVLIILKNPYPTFAPWPDTWDHGDEGPPEVETPVPHDFEFLVSSEKLTRDSDYFRAALNGPWHHEQVAPGITKSEIKDLDEEALTIVLRIIHGRSNPCLESHMTLELVAKVALVADYLQCQEAVSEVVETWTWMQELTNPLYECYEVTRDIVLWIFISTVFRLEEEFGCSVRLAMEIGTGPIPTMGLPIPDRIVCKFHPARGESWRKSSGIGKSNKFERRWGNGSWDLLGKGNSFAMVGGFRAKEGLRGIISNIPGRLKKD